MATKFYLLNQTAPYTPATIRGAWDDSAGAVTRALSTSKTGGGSFTTVARAETNASNTWDVLLYRGVSGPLAAQTISGTVDVVIGALESNSAADFYWHIHIYATQGDSDTPRGTLLTDYVENTTNEFPTTATGRALQSAQALTSLAVSAGDRLVVEIGYIARNSVTTSRTGTINYGTQLSANPFGDASDLTSGSTNVTTLAGFISFSGTVSEAAVGERISQLPIEVFSEGSTGVQLSQLPVEISSSGSKALRLSQLAVEVFASHQDTAPLRLSQLPVEIFAQWGGAVPIVSDDFPAMFLAM